MTINTSTPANVNNRTNLFLNETINLILIQFFNWLTIQKSRCFLLTSKNICFTYTPKKIPLREHIRAADFGLINKKGHGIFN